MKIKEASTTTIVATEDVQDGGEEITISEDQSMTLMEAIDWWMEPETRRTLVETERVAIAEEIRSFIARRKLNEQRRMLPLLWLRLILEAGRVPAPAAINAFLEWERDRQPREELLLYQLVEAKADLSEKKKRYRAKKCLRFPGRVLTGWTALEVLLMPAPKGVIREMGWPYEQEWRVVSRFRSLSEEKTLRSIETNKTKWRRLAELMESALKAELNRSTRGTTTPLIRKGASDGQRLYSSTLTLAGLAKEMQSRHQSIRNYSETTVAKVLGSFVQTRRGRHVLKATRIKPA